MKTAQQSSATSECRQCGSCCRQGGPALHKEDLPLLRGEHFSRDHLVTIRTGEPAYDPRTGTTQPVKQELIKLTGRDASWTCRFFDYADTSCSIYQYRPLECRLLKCWDTRELEDMIGRNTLERLDLINPSDPVLNLLAAQDEKCDYTLINPLIDSLQKHPGDNSALKELTLTVRADLMIRAHARQNYSISLARELFLFGRPVFKVLAACGFRVQEAGHEIFLHPPGTN